MSSVATNQEIMNPSEPHESPSLSLAAQTQSRHDKEEQEHFDVVCESFRQYATFAMCHLRNVEHRLNALPKSQRALLPARLCRDTDESQARSSTFREAAIRNQFCLDCILHHAGKPHSQEQNRSTRVVGDGQISKVSSVLKSLARDWSLDGKEERDMVYHPILTSIGKFLPVSHQNDDTSPPRLCVPGAGVGRLAWELVNRGYAVQGNEFSLHMLLASDFILNGQVCTPNRPMAISPWLLETRNVHGADDPIRKIMIPDVDPVEMLNSDSPSDFSMAAGDFASIYADPSQHAKWDGVVCCFFLDAAPSIVHYIQVIHSMLKEGGLLFSLGPLLYHWLGPTLRPDDESYEAYQARFRHLDQRYMNSVEFCWEDIEELLIKAGFVIEEEHLGIPSLYTADTRSMMNTSYRCIHFIARKKSSGTRK